MIRLTVLLLLLLTNLNTYSQGFFDLGGAEKLWVVLHPFSAKKAKRISQESSLSAKEVAIKMNWVNESGGLMDAYRHTYWMSRLSCEIGPKRASWLGKAHEKKNYKDFKKAKVEDGSINDEINSKMDLFNNQVGIKQGESCKKSDSESLAKEVIELINSGSCRIIKMDSLGNSLNENGLIIPTNEWQGKWENQRVLTPSNVSL